MKMAVLGIEKVGRILEKMVTDVDGREWVVRAMTAPQSGKKLCVLTIIWCFYECFYDISVQRILELFNENNLKEEQCSVHLLALVSIPLLPFMFCIDIKYADLLHLFQGFNELYSFVTI